MQRPATPPRWRSLFFPGGTEYYELAIPSEKFLLQIGIGNPYSKRYRQQHLRYLRQPTQFPPALPAHFPFAYVSHSEGHAYLDAAGSEIHWDDSISISLGPAQLRWMPGTISWKWDDLTGTATAQTAITTAMTPDGMVRETAFLEAIQKEQCRFPDEPGRPRPGPGRGHPGSPSTATSWFSNSEFAIIIPFDPTAPATICHVISAGIHR